MSKLLHFCTSMALVVALLGILATPARAADDPAIHFLGADYLSGKGLVLYFHVPMGFEFESIAKNVVVNSVEFPLICQFNVNGLLACVAGVKKSDIGNKALITFGVSEFEAIIPEASVRACRSSYTYSVYDYGPNDIPWGLIGTVTQPCQALVGDVIVFYNENWAGLTVENGYFDYTYVLNGGAACAPNFGDGYYYDDC